MTRTAASDAGRAAVGAVSRRAGGAGGDDYGSNGFVSGGHEDRRRGSTGSGGSGFVPNALKRGVLMYGEPDGGSGGGGGGSSPRSGGGGPVPPPGGEEFSPRGGGGERGAPALNAGIFSSFPPGVGRRRGRGDEGFGTSRRGIGGVGGDGGGIAGGLPEGGGGSSRVSAYVSEVLGWGRGVLCCLALWHAYNRAVLFDTPEYVFFRRRRKVVDQYFAFKV